MRKFSLLDGHWLSVRDGDPRALQLYLRHYSAKKKRGETPDRSVRGNHARIAGPGQNLVLLTVDSSALFVWRKEQHRRDEQRGANCTIFRNEGVVLSSDLILEAMAMAWQKWPFERLFTFVDESQIRPKADPGRCFLMAGWERCRARTKGRGLLIFECEPLWMGAA